MFNKPTILPSYLHGDFFIPVAFASTARLAVFVVHPPLNMVLHVIKPWVMAPPSVIAPLGPSIPPVRWSRAASWRGSSGEKGGKKGRFWWDGETRRQEMRGYSVVLEYSKWLLLAMHPLSVEFLPFWMQLLLETSHLKVAISKIKRKENLVPRNSPMGSLRCVPRLIHVLVPGHHGGP